MPNQNRRRNANANDRAFNITNFMYRMEVVTKLMILGFFFCNVLPYLLENNETYKKFRKWYESTIANQNDRHDCGEKYNYNHSILLDDHDAYVADPAQLLEERNDGMKKYSFPFNKTGVDKRSLLRIQEFSDVYDGKWPVIITDIVPKWPASNWTTKFFLKHYKGNKVVMQAVHHTRKESVALPIDLFISHLGESFDHSWTYVQDELFIVQRPELREQVLESVYTKNNFFSLFPKEVRPWDCMLLWGTAHSKSTLHVDPYNWTGTNAVISGKKLWKLVPPGQDHLLGIENVGMCGFPMECFKYNSPLDAHEPQSPREREMVSRIRFVEVEQNAGEMLFIPPGWFHQAYNEVPTLAVSGQLMNANNYKVVLEEIFKGESLSRHQLPYNMDQFSPEELVAYLAESISDDVREKGAEVTKSILTQMKNEGKDKN